MSTTSINITLEESVLERSDKLVKDGRYSNRSRFIEESIVEKLKRIDEEEIGKQALLLNNSDESEEWFEGELDSWQEEY